MPARKAYGAHRKVSNEQKAQFIAESIMFRMIEGREWSWLEYGLSDAVYVMAKMLLVVELAAKVEAAESVEDQEKWKNASLRIIT